MSVARRSTKDGSSFGLMPGIAIGLFVLAVWSSVQTLGGAPYEVPITDLERDLIGARASQLGASPYQTIGDLSALVENSEINPSATSLWVAHTPFSIATARIWLAVTGDNAIEIASILEVVAALALAVTLGWRVGRGSTIWHGLALSAGVLISLGWRSDLFWLQGAALVGLGIVAFQYLNQLGRHTSVALLLGLLIAFRPWLIPMAFLIPNRRSLLQDLTLIGTVGMAVTAVSVAWLGGWPVLVDWITLAIPGNFDDYSGFTWNLSVTGSVLPLAISSLLVVVVSLAFGLVRDRILTDWWMVLAALISLTLSPFVWAQYWLALTPVFFAEKEQIDVEYGLLAVVVFAWPVAERSGVAASSASLLAALLMVLGGLRAQAARSERELNMRVTQSQN